MQNTKIFNFFVIYSCNKKLSIMEQELNDILVNILQTRQDLVYIVIKQRAKFEGWLKFELANKLCKKYSDTCVEKCMPYNDSEKLVDVFSNNSYIELKTPNTSYRHKDCENRTRPITNNIASIIDDINALKSIAVNGYIAFVMFPIDNNGKYQSHINKIDKIISNSIKTIFQINNIPILIYTAKV